MLRLVPLSLLSALLPAVPRPTLPPSCPTGPPLPRLEGGCLPPARTKGAGI